MNKKLKQQKLKMWRENLKKLEEELAEVMAKKSQAAQQGDISENIAYSLAQEEETTCRVRIEEVKKIIKELEKS